MFVISKKALRFVLRDKDKAAIDTRIVRPGIMTQLPKWVKNDELFKLAKQEGSITFVDHQANTHVPKLPSGNSGNESGEDAHKTEGDKITFLTPDEVGKMERTALLDYAAKLGIEGLRNNISIENLILRVNEFIVEKKAGRIKRG